MNRITLITLVALGLYIPQGWAAEEASQPASATAASVPQTKLVDTFTPLAGSSDNATALVQGLRQGTPVELTNPDGSTVSFVPQTKPMGYGNIRIALSLAKYQLASQGITDPTAEQLQTALAGTGDQQGILQMRASGMGWGQIANSMGTKLGSVMSGHTPAASSTYTTGAGVTSSTTTATGPHGKSSGIITAEGTHTHHSGITTAEGVGGSSAGNGMTTNHSHSASTMGVVNAAGSNAGVVGSAHGAGHAASGKR